MVCGCHRAAKGPVLETPAIQCAAFINRRGFISDRIAPDALKQRTNTTTITIAEELKLFSAILEIRRARSNYSTLSEKEMRLTFLLSS
jgi:hypothetical protein